MKITLHGGHFHGRSFDREDCRIGHLLMVTGISTHGLDFQLYRVRVQIGERFAASVDRDGEGVCHRVLLPGTV